MFYSIRNLGTPFIVAQRQAKEQERAAEAANQDSLENQVKEQFLAGNYPVLLKFVKCLFSVLFLPFYFCLVQLPSLLLDKVLKPLFVILCKFYRRVVEMVVPPCVKLFLWIYRPIAFVCKMIIQLCLRLTLILKPLISGVFRFLSHGAVFFKSLLRMIQRSCAFISKFFKFSAYILKLTYIWSKLLLSFGFKFIREKNSSTAKN